MSVYGTIRTGPRFVANGRYFLKKRTLAILAAPRHAAAWDAQESGLWQPQRKLPGQPRRLSTKAGPGAHRPPDELAVEGDALMYSGLPVKPRSHGRQSTFRSARLALRCGAVARRIRGHRGEGISPAAAEIPCAV